MIFYRKSNYSKFSLSQQSGVQDYFGFILTVYKNPINCGCKMRFAFEFMVLTEAEAVNQMNSL